MKSINQEEQNLFSPKPVRHDDIEQARHKMSGYANNPNKITKQHLLARRGLLDALYEGLGAAKDSISPLHEIQRIESTLAEFDQEVALNRNRKIDSELEYSGDLERITSQINEARSRIQNDVKNIKRRPDIVALMDDQKRAQEQANVNTKIKDGKIQLLKDKLGIDFNEANLEHHRAIELIYDFNQVQSSMSSQLEESKIKAVFNMFVNHPELLETRKPNDVIESARVGIDIIHKALKVKGRFLSMGDWTASEPKIINKLLPELSRLDAKTLEDLSTKIIDEYAQSIWNNRDNSAVSVIAKGVGSISDQGLNQVVSPTLNSSLGLSSHEDMQQTGVLQGIYESVRKATPNPFSKKPALSPSASARTQEPEQLMPKFEKYQEECALAAYLFESAMTNTEELKALAANNCFEIKTKIANATNPEELQKLKAQISRMRELAQQAEGLVREASLGVEEISFAISEDLVGIGAKREEMLNKKEEAAILTLSEEDLFSDKPLPGGQIFETQNSQTLADNSDNELTEGLKRAQNLKDISSKIINLDLPNSAAIALASVNAVLAEADIEFKDRLSKIADERVAKEQQTAEAKTAKSFSGSIQSFLPSMPSIFKRGAKATQENTKQQEKHDVESFALKASRWRQTALNKASAVVSSGAEVAGQAALEGLRGLSGGATYIALNTAAESARLAKRYPKAAAAMGAAYGAVQVAAFVVAAAPIVAGAAVAGAALNTETGQVVAGLAVEGAAAVGSAAARAAANNPKAMAAAAGAAGVIGVGLAAAAAAPYVAAAAALNTKAGKQVAGAVIKGVGDGMAVAARTQIEGGAGSVEVVAAALDGARGLASHAQQIGSTVRNFVSPSASSVNPDNSISRSKNTPPTSAKKRDSKERS